MKKMDLNTIKNLMGIGMMLILTGSTIYYQKKMSKAYLETYCAEEK